MSLSKTVYRVIYHKTSIYFDLSKIFSNTSTIFIIVFSFYYTTFLMIEFSIWNSQNFKFAT